MDSDDWRIVKATENMASINIGCVKSKSEIKVSCISRITEVLLAYWMLSGKDILIKTGNCKKCKLRNSLVCFRENVKKAVAIVRSVGIEPRFRLKREEAEITYVPKRAVSRRDIFSGVFKVFKKGGRTKRELLLGLIKDKEINKDLTYPEIGTININDKCNLCGVCEYVCPSDAILIKKGYSSGEILFYPSLCVGCGECEKACIRDALNFIRGNVKDFKRGIIDLFRAEKNICKICGKEFYSSDKQDVCPVCKNKEESKRKFLEFLKNI